jgi:hypothetical protein
MTMNIQQELEEPPRKPRSAGRSDLSTEKPSAETSWEVVEPREFQQRTIALIADAVRVWELKRQIRGVAPSKAIPKNLFFFERFGIKIRAA